MKALVGAEWYQSIVVILESQHARRVTTGIGVKPFRAGMAFIHRNGVLDHEKARQPRSIFK